MRRRDHARDHVQASTPARTRPARRGQASGKYAIKNQASMQPVRGPRDVAKQVRMRVRAHAMGETRTARAKQVCKLFYNYVNLSTTKVGVQFSGHTSTVVYNTRTQLCTTHEYS
jgi:hypothetical protein